LRQLLGAGHLAADIFDCVQLCIFLIDGFIIFGHSHRLQMAFKVATSQEN
jgi:hypothetical protein